MGWVFFRRWNKRIFVENLFYHNQLVLRWFFCFACRYGVTFLRVGETPGYKLILFSKKSVFMQWSKIWPTVFYSCITMEILWYMLFVLFYPAWMKFRFVQMRVQTLFQCNNKHILMIFRIPPPLHWSDFGNFYSCLQCDRCGILFSVYSKWLAFLWFVSLLVSYRSKETPIFGHTLCFTSENDSLHWMAAMLVAQVNFEH